MLTKCYTLDEGGLFDKMILFPAGECIWFLNILRITRAPLGCGDELPENQELFA